MTSPYQPPGPSPDALPASRTPFILAGIGGFAAAGYWALLTLILGFAVYSGAGGVSTTSVVMPVVLIALYAYRGVLVMRGDPRSAKSLLWLHAVGGLFAAFSLATSIGMFAAFLQGLKVAIHIFGGITAHAATKQRWPNQETPY